MKTAVFTGPTLPESVVHELFRDAIVFPPAQQGDVYAACQQGFELIAIIDGYFESQPSVWHKEILWALSVGIHVYGSASMGALRAAELADFGMVGVGSIFESFRDGILEDDDEVAIVHGPEEMGYLACSEAMVNIRATLHEAVAQEIIEESQAIAIEKALKSLHFSSRTFEAVLRQGELPLQSEILERFKCWLINNRVDAKRSDAVAMLSIIKRLAVANTGKHIPNFTFQDTVHWERFKKQPSLRSKLLSSHDELVIRGYLGT